MTQHVLTKAAVSLWVAVALYGTSLAAQQGPPPPEFLTTVQSSQSFDETVSVLTRAIEGENLMVVHEVDAQQMLRMVGMRTAGMKQILYFHPRFMQQIIETNRNGGIVPPLKILVMERPDGGVMVRYHDPEALFSSYQGLEGVTRELTQLYAFGLQKFLLITSLVVSGLRSQTSCRSWWACESAFCPPRCP